MSLPFLLFLIACLMLVSAWLLQPWWTRRRRERLRETPFPASWRRILQHRVPLLQRLPPDLQMQLKRHIQVFLAEKPFIGCGGLAIDDDIRVTVAAQACLPLLNRPDACYPELRQILVYPGPFVVDRSHTDGIGVLQNMRQVLAGESWSQGQVILSWQDVVADTAHPEAGRNVVIHEFAHQLDQESGAANGAPELGSAQAYARWSQVLGTEFEQLQRRAEQGPTGVLDTYGASSPAEFFAVASEAFFLRPGPLATDHPLLFAELRRFYCIDPLSW
jgi:Mlc titration factor MtfA (ptsG expression regulator)